MVTFDDISEDRIREEAARAREAHDRENVMPVFLLCGKTGSGKSSLLNALAGAGVQEVGVVPTTQAPEWARLDSGEQTLKAIDVPGFGEADLHEERLETMYRQLKVAHVVLMVVGLPDRALDYEVAFLRGLRARAHGPDTEAPVVVAANKIDLAKPRGEWSPGTLDLKARRTDKARNIGTWFDYVGSTVARHANLDVVPCSAGENWYRTQDHYGVQDLKRSLYQALPKGARTWFARIVRDKELLDHRAREIIIASALTAGTAALQPVPAIPDAALIAPIQVAMITGLVALHGGDPKQIDASRLLGPAVASVAGRLVFAQAVKLVPFGSAVGASIAAVVTLSLGEAYHQLLSAGIFEPSREQYLRAFDGVFETYKDMGIDGIRKMLQDL